MQTRTKTFHATLNPHDLVIDGTVREKLIPFDNPAILFEHAIMWVGKNWKQGSRSLILNKKVFDKMIEDGEVESDVRYGILL